MSLLKLNAFSIADADLIFVLESKCAYLSVVLELECPNQSCISLKDIPFFKSNVAFRRICSYYIKFNPQATWHYINYYIEEYDPQKLKFGNKSKEE